MRLVILIAVLGVATAGAADPQRYDYRILNIQNISKMEQEMNEAAVDGYSFQALIGREDEALVIVMVKALDGKAHGSRTYKLLSASKTSAMRRQLQDAGADGFKLLEMTVANTSFWHSNDLVSILSKEEQ